MTNKTNNFLWVDYAKAIGIILVCYGHVARGLDDANIIGSSNIFDTVDNIVYSFHMPLFFFLAGIFFFKSLEKRGLKKFCLSKTSTILYPYFLWSILQGIIMVILSKYTNANMTINDLLQIPIRPYGQFWFLYIIFIAFLSSALIFSSKKISQNKLLILHIILVTSVILYLISPDISTRIPRLFFQFFVFFIMGCYFGDKKIRNNVLQKSKLWLLFLVFIIFQYYFHIIIGFSKKDINLYSLTIAITSILFICKLCYVVSGKLPFLFSWIGQCSMSIYLMHILIGSGARIILHKFFNIDSITIHIIVGVSAGVVMPCIIHAIIKRYKIRYVLSFS